MNNSLTSYQIKKLNSFFKTREQTNKINSGACGRVALMTMDFLLANKIPFSLCMEKATVDSGRSFWEGPTYETKVKIPKGYYLSVNHVWLKVGRSCLNRDNGRADLVIASTDKCFKKVYNDLKKSVKDDKTWNNGYSEWDKVERELMGKLNELMTQTI